MNSTKFSLFDFCKKHAARVEIYGNETIDEEGNIIPFIEQAAIITHYLRLSKRNIDIPYRDKAEDILKFWYEFIQGKSISNTNATMVMAAEPNIALQQSLFPDLFQAPFQAQRNSQFTFIDLFAGIGGFRMA